MVVSSVTLHVAINIASPLDGLANGCEIAMKSRLVLRGKFLTSG